MNKLLLIFKVYYPFGWKVLLCEIWYRTLLWFSKRDANYIKRREHIISVLTTSFPDFVERCKRMTLKYNEHPQKVIWLFWYQGIESAPPIVRVCTKYIKINCNGYKINILSYENYTKYVEIPDYIIQKHKDNKISIVHFSDILRYMLLSKYGGFWMDASILLTQPIDSSIIDFPFFSLKTAKENSISISDYRWSTFFMYSKSHNNYVEMVRDFMLMYFKKYDYAIDYLQIDYIMEILYRNNPSFSQMIDNIPFSNPQLRYLSMFLDKKFDSDLFAKKTLNTQIFKISRHYQYDEKTIDGSLTLFGYLVKKLE